MGTPSGVVVLPARFKPTHPTSGLPGFPAVDVFQHAGRPVSTGFGGIVTRISGRPCHLGGRPGGSYGISVYVTDRRTREVRFVTHLEQLLAVVGDAIWPGRVLGTICLPPSGSPPGSAHAHLGHYRP